MVVGDVTTGTEVLVIGGGPGGYVAAIRAAQEGLDVTLVERDAYGGVCLNRGCIPSKALVEAAGLAHRAGHAEEMGVHADPVVDLAATQSWKDGVVSRLTGGVEKLCKANGVNLVEGTARFSGAHSARVEHGGEGQGSESIEFEHAIIATGSRPIEIPNFDFADDPILDSASALALESVPERLCVVGAGYIGMELSSVFAKLGTDVHVLEMLDDVLPGYEDDVRRTVRRRAEELGIEFTFGAGASDWQDGVDGGVAVTAASDDGDEHTVTTDRVLVAVGRRPVTDTVNLDAVGLEPNEAGFLETDAEARTDVEHVFAVGDVAGEPMLAHKASKEGVVAAEVIADEPAAVFTDPEVATVGLTEAEAEAEGFDPAVGKMAFGGSGRALTRAETDGFVRVVADAETEFVLGAQIVGAEASELIAELALAVEMGATLADLGGTVHTHPTLGEAVMEAAENARGRAIHTLNR